MNYDHAFHAGNFCDVVKHIALVLVLERLVLKDKPFFVLDTHAGRGQHDLSSREAERGGDWQRGIGRLVAKTQDPRDAERLPPGIRTLLQMVDTLQPDQRDPARALRFYPGSPLLAAQYLRPVDRLVANDVSEKVAEELKSRLAAFKTVRVTSDDGWALVKSLLPPKERRGVILIDPPFEENGDLDRMVAALREGHRRFSNGIFLLWYPIKDRRLINRFHRNLAASGIPDIAAYEFLVQSERVINRLNGCGLAVVNAPFQFRERYAESLRALVPILAEDNDGRCQVLPLGVQDR